MVPSNKKPTVVLADDHVGMLNKVSELLGQQVRIVAKVRDGSASIQAAVDHNPDVLILDIAMPGLNGIQAAREMRRRGLASSIIFLTVQDDAELVDLAETIGASYVLKPRMHTDLLFALNETLLGRRFISTIASAASQAHSK
jgi:DNA-binding NarL/FixJ family response regulator